MHYSAKRPQAAPDCQGVHGTKKFRATAPCMTVWIRVLLPSQPTLLPQGPANLHWAAVMSKKGINLFCVEPLRLGGCLLQPLACPDPQWWTLPSSSGAFRPGLQTSWYLLPGWLGGVKGRIRVEWATAEVVILSHQGGCSSLSQGVREMLSSLDLNRRWGWAPGDHTACAAT